MDKELEEQLKTIEEMGLAAYKAGEKAGFKAGYEARDKEIKEAQTKAVELEAKLEDEAEALKQQGIKDEDGKVLEDEEIDWQDKGVPTMNEDYQNLSKKQKEDLM